MGIKSFTINGSTERYEYGSLIGRIASASFDNTTKEISFKDENETILFTTNISALSLATDSTLTVSGKAADAKSTGDSITAIRRTIPTIDSSLSVTGNAADAKAVGDAIGSLEDADDDITDSIGELSSLNTSVKTSIVDAVNSVNQDLTTYKGVKNLDDDLQDDKISRLQSRATTAETNISNLQAADNSNRVIVTSLQTTVDGLSSNVDSLNSDVQSLQGSVDTIEESLADTLSEEKNDKKIKAILSCFPNRSHLPDQYAYDINDETGRRFADNKSRQFPPMISDSNAGFTIYFPTEYIYSVYLYTSTSASTYVEKVLSDASGFKYVPIPEDNYICLAVHKVDGSTYEEEEQIDGYEIITYDVGTSNSST